MEDRIKSKDDQDLRENLRKMTFPEKVDHIWRYYRIPIIIAAAAVIFIVSLSKSILSQKTCVLHADFLNGITADDTKTEAVTEGFASYAGIDLKKQDVILEGNLYVTQEISQMSYEDMQTHQILMVKMAAKEIDALAADAVTYDYYTEIGAFSDLREVMTEEELAAFEGRIYYADRAYLAKVQQAMEDPNYVRPVLSDEEIRAKTDPALFVMPDPAEMEDPIPVGIMANGLAPMEELGFYPNTVCIIGVTSNGANPGNAVKFLQYLLNGQT